MAFHNHIPVDLMDPSIDINAVAGLLKCMGLIARLPSNTFSVSTRAQ